MPGYIGYVIDLTRKDLEVDNVLQRSGSFAYHLSGCNLCIFPDSRLEKIVDEYLRAL